MTTIKKINTANVSENVEQMGHSYIVSENEKWLSHLENCLAFSYKVKYTFTIWSSNSIPGHLPKINNKHTHTDLCKNDHDGFLYNNPKLEPTQCPSTEKWINKLQ